MSSIVSIFVTSPDTHSERRYDLHLTVGQLKAKLELVTGIPAQSQSLSLYRNEDDQTPIAVLDDESKALGFYSVASGQFLKVRDTNPNASMSGQFTDVSQVEKFDLTKDDETWADTVKSYIEKHQMGRFAPKTDSPATPTLAEISAQYPIGSRCEVATDAGPKYRGTIRFVGETEFGNKTGVWIGVEYDEAWGKNDGSVEGKRYFTCPPAKGAFARPKKVTVGDFPPEDLGLDDEDEEL
ncbi:Tubulin-folding cofactor B AltName: Full=Cytoskeleton-associated protein 1; AltName: Full=Cytoskeleton-associated protein CKAPI; AltName: Full=Tubulin-specific chaperone B [Serendipita indica DSM 11827]|nr:Tubulin-folding cofactor B AltName: Full=Cytoskeleton-associated protein 1; AltName: Full=Cytoskeleton-associated protein CKAPI; AltName: Full=Tubulin-specific chaperone B [Serendipita indica DSM 11827]